MNTDLKHHEMYKELSKHIYQIGTKSAPKGAVPLYVHENKDNGFFGCAYKYQDRIVIVFRGTQLDERNDIENDLGMYRNKIPPQATDAILFTNQIKKVIKKNYSGYKLDLTGHSLGGSLCQYVHVLIKGINETVTFHPYGTSDTLEKYLFENESKNPIKNITNYYVKSDPISGLISRHTQIGKCYKIEPKDEVKNLKYLYKRHFIENMQPLSTRVPVTQTKSIQSRMDNKCKQANKYVVEITNKMLEKSRGITAKVKEKVHTSYLQTGCVGSYPVSGYTRSDGTKVEGYIRTCGAKHKGMSLEERRLGQAKYKNKRFQDIPLDELETAIGYFV